MVSKYGWKILGFIVVLIVADIIAIGIYFTFWPSSTSTPSSYDVLSPLPPSNSTLGVFRQAAVVSLGAPCAGFGRDMLAKNGSMVDAAIATLLCDGVCVMQSMGVGGGFVMTIYDKPNNKTYSLIARETAPAAATQDMYVNHSDWAQLGALSAGIPGELKGYQEAHKKFGKLPWSELFQPTIKLCEEGFRVNKRMADHFISEAADIKASPTFISSILNSTGGRLPVEGEIIKLPQLAQTLRVIADSPIMADELYNGSLTKAFVADIQAGGGIITEEDMNKYQVRWEEPYSATLKDGHTVFSSALPGSGVLVTFILRVLDGLLQFAYSDLQRSQMIVEAFKHAYGRRTHLGDPHFVNATLLNETLSMLTDEESILETRSRIQTNWTSNNYTYYGGDYYGEEHGTNNIVVLAPDGSAVSVTSTVNLIFGSKFVSTSTGILLNDQMDDFSTPGVINYFHINPSEANFIQPGKRPLSSMSPTIVVDSQGDVRLVVGGAGGSKITTQTALVSIRNLWLGKNIKEAIDLPRFHHQLLPMNISYEYGVLQEVVDGWHAIGHSTRRVARNDFLAVVTGIARLGNNVTANCDWRKPGSIQGF